MAENYFVLWECPHITRNGWLLVLKSWNRWSSWKSFHYGAMGRGIGGVESVEGRLYCSFARSNGWKFAFHLKTDASGNAVSAKVVQQNRPEDFFYRMLSKHEICDVSVENETLTVVEAIRKWERILTGRHIATVTDQRHVSVMYDTKKDVKIKKIEKNLRWRNELAQFDFDIVYCTTQNNCAPDTLSRSYCVIMHKSKFNEGHESFCYPGTTRFIHFVSWSIIAMCPLNIQQCAPKLNVTCTNRSLHNSSRALCHLNTQAWILGPWFAAFVDCKWFICSLVLTSIRVFHLHFLALALMLKPCFPV